MKILLKGLGALLAILGVLVAIGLFFHFTAKEVPLEAKDHEMIVKADDLTGFVEGFVPTSTAENISKVKFIDGSIEINYEYTNETNDDDPYLNITISKEKKRSDATTVYHSEWTGMKLGLGISGGEITIDENNIYKFGDVSRFAIIKIGEEPFGNIFISRIGNNIYSFMLSGIYFDDQETFKSLIENKLEKLKLE